MQDTSDYAEALSRLRRQPLQLYLQVKYKVFMQCQNGFMITEWSTTTAKYCLYAEEQVSLDD